MLNTTTGRSIIFKVVYGYDDEQEEFFIQASYVGKGGSDSFILDKGIKTTNTSPAEMFMFYTLLGVSEEHKTFLALDLKF
jgi:hypothetical protein